MSKHWSRTGQNSVERVRLLSLFFFSSGYRTYGIERLSWMIPPSPTTAGRTPTSPPPTCTRFKTPDFVPFVLGFHNIFLSLRMIIMTLRTSTDEISRRLFFFTKKDCLLDLTPMQRLTFVGTKTDRDKLRAFFDFSAEACRDWLLNNATPAGRKVDSPIIP